MIEHSLIVRGTILLDKPKTVARKNTVNREEVRLGGGLNLSKKLDIMNPLNHQV